MFDAFNFLRDIAATPINLNFCPIAQRAMVRGAIEAAKQDRSRTIAEKTDAIANAFGLHQVRADLEGLLRSVC